MQAQERVEWRDALQMFAELIELDADARRARLVELELSDGVREKLRRLLAESHSERTWLDHEVSVRGWLVGAAEQAAQDLVGHKVGTWQLDELIGSGGMASVYRAHLVGRDYEQDAAVKILHVLLRGPAEQARFRRERQILARLQHPHIATLLDGGVADDGTPYLVMERVIGERIDSWCDARKLSRPERVRLFLKVCSAVAYAHRQLVVHRDLKPGNILVEDDGRVVLLDFGIANLDDTQDKAAGAADDPANALAYTPDYSAPEQRNVGDAANDTAVDVYGLGAVLHRMLTGRPPHGSASDPRTNVSAAALDADLKAILDKSLSTDPTARYSDANSLHDDLVAWLDLRPVRARGGGSGYRLAKWARRRKGVVAAAAVVLLCVLGGIAATLWQARQALREAERTATVLGYVENLLDDMVPRAGEIELDRSSVLSRASKDAVAYFAEDPLALAHVRTTLANLHARIGNYAEASALFAKAHGTMLQDLGAENPETAAVLAQWASARVSLAEFDKARVEADFQRAIAVLGHHPEAALALFEARIGYAQLLAESGNSEAALSALLANAGTELPTTASATRLRLQNLSTRAAIYNRLTQPNKALPLIEQALATARESFAADESTHAHLLMTRARIYLGMRDIRAIDDLEQAMRTLVRLYPEGNELTQSARIAHLRALQYAGRIDDAISIATQQLDDFRTRLGPSHPSYGRTLNMLANLQLSSGRFAAAETSYREAMTQAIATQGAEHAAVAILRGNVADALYEQRKLKAARPLREQSMQQMCAIFGDDSGRCASQHSAFGRILLAGGEAAQAERHFRIALALYRKVYGDGIATALLGAWVAEAERQQSDIANASRDMHTATATLADLAHPAARPAAIIMFLDARLTCATKPAQCAARAAAITEQVTPFYPSSHPFGRELASWRQPGASSATITTD